MSNIAMRILQKIQASITEAEKEIKLETAALADGTTIEAEAFEVGMVAFVPVEDGEAVAVPAGTYELDNGMTITTDENGVIVDVSETSAEGEEDAPPAPPATSTEAAAAPVGVAKKTIERKELETIFSAEQKQEIEKSIADGIAAKLVELSSENEKKYEALKLELSDLKAANEMLETKLTEAPATAALPRTKQTEVVKLSAEEVANLSPSQRILYKTRNLKKKS